MASQAVDDAMALNRPAKRTVRSWWADCVRRRRPDALERGEVIYLTLPGKHGLDIKFLIQEGLVDVTEAGPIVVTSPPQIVAFEKNMQAVGQLKRDFPGLAVRPQDLHDAVGGSAPDAFANNAELKKFARAAVVNLDFTVGWHASSLGMNSLLTVITKFAAVHEARNARGQLVDAHDWSLCLTLNARLLGTHDERVAELDFVFDQVRDIDDLRDLTDGQLSAAFAELRTNSDALDEPASELAQRVLVLLVPLRLIHALLSRGWRVDCVRSAIYGGETDAAAMVTFVFDISATPEAASKPTEVSRECRTLLFPSVVRLLADGAEEPLFSPVA